MALTEGVYYSEEHDNFYDAETLQGMGQEFYSEWIDWKNYFNRSAVTARRIS